MNDFNQEELNILKEFDDIYINNIDNNNNNNNHNNNNDNNNTMVHVFNESLENYMFFDPLFKYKTNSENYLTYLVINDIKNQGLTYIIKKDIDIDNFVYTKHCKAFNYYIINADMEYIYYEDFINKIKTNDESLLNNKYMLLYPYLYSDKDIQEIKILNNQIIISQEIPFTNNKQFNEYVLNKWYKYVSIN